MPVIWLLPVTQLLSHTTGHTQAAAAPKHYVLQYSYVPDMMQKRDPHRQAHLDAIKQWVRDLGIAPAMCPSALRPAAFRRAAACLIASQFTSVTRP